MSSSIVDAARLMVERYGPSDTTDPTGHTWCGGCGNLIGVPYPCSDQIEHVDGCPSVAMPKILAALEAAQVMVYYAVKCLNQSGDCPICPGDVTEHMDYCPVGTLLEAYGYRAEDM